MARRKKIFGLPIGRKKKSIAPKAIAAGVGIAAVPAIAVSRRLGGSLGKGREKVEEGREQLENVGDIASKVSHISEAMGEHSSPIGKIGAVIGEVRKMGNGDGSPKLSHLIEEHTDVAVPRSVAYNQWTQFEAFPSIVKGAERTEQQEDQKLEWTAKIGPSHRTWQTEITEQVPDERIAWKSTGGLQLRGVVTFHSLDEDLTHVLVQMEYTPKGIVEGVGNVLRIPRRRVRRDLRLFKHFIELRGKETGAWRGTVGEESGNESDGESSRSGRSTNRAGRSQKRAKKAAASKKAASSTSARRSSRDKSARAKKAS